MKFRTSLEQSYAPARLSDGSGWELIYGLRLNDRK